MASFAPLRGSKEAQPFFVSLRGSRAVRYSPPTQQFTKN